MGNKNSGEIQSLSQDTYRHPRLGKIIRIQTSEYAQQKIGYTIPIENMKTFKKWERNVRQLKNRKCEQLLFIPTDYRFSQSGLCGKVGEVKLIYRDFMFSLKEEIANRAKIRRPFREAEIWYILYKLLETSRSLHQAQLTIGDVRPHNIIVNEEGQINIISQFSWPGLQQVIKQGVKDEFQIMFLAPEQLKSTKNRLHFLSQECQINQRHKAQIFSIGLTLLEVSSLIEGSKLYEKKRFIEENLSSYFEVVQERYSKNLSMILREMMKMDPDLRANAQYLMKILKPHESSILNFKEFSLLMPKKFINEHRKLTINSSCQSNRSWDSNSSNFCTRNFNNSSETSQETNPVLRRLGQTRIVRHVSSVYPQRTYSYPINMGIGSGFYKFSFRASKRDLMNPQMSHKKMYYKNPLSVSGYNFS